MVISPLPAHESILREIAKMLTNILATMPISEKILNRTVVGNTPFIGQLIFGIPNLMVLTVHRGSLKERQWWIMECAFSQRDEDATQRLRQYIHDDPDLLVVGKIIIKQASTYRSPGSDVDLATQLRSAPLMTLSEWLGLKSNEDEFGQVKVDGFTWFSLAHVEIHLWVRSPGNSAINLDRLDGNSYASGVHDLCRTFLHANDMFDLTHVDVIPNCQP